MRIGRVVRKSLPLATDGVVQDLAKGVEIAIKMGGLFLETSTEVYVFEEAYAEVDSCMTGKGRHIHACYPAGTQIAILRAGDGRIKARILLDPRGCRSPNAYGALAWLLVARLDAKGVQVWDVPPAVKSLPDVWVDVVVPRRWARRVRRESVVIHHDACAGKCLAKGSVQDQLEAAGVDYWGIDVEVYAEPHQGSGGLEWRCVAVARGLTTGVTPPKRVGYGQGFGPCPPIIEKCMVARAFTPHVDVN